MISDLALKFRAVLSAGALNYLPLKLGNLSLNWVERRIGRTRLCSLPLGADIVTTRRCNCHCIMCIGYTSRPPLEMPLALFQEIARRLFPMFVYVRFASGGEHFLHPEFRTMLSICRKYGCPVTIVTNGTLIDREWAEFLVRESSVWSLIISFDGARRATFNAIRRGAEFDEVLQNTRRVLRLRNEAGAALPAVSLRFVAMRRNIEELPDLVRLAAEISVDQVHVAYLTVGSGFDPQESLWHHRALAENSFVQARALAAQYRIDLRLPRPMRSVTPSRFTHPCVLPWTQLYIDPSGSLRLCCNAWDDFEPMGEIPTGDFRNVWNNERYVAVRASMLRGKPLYWRCRNCPALARDPSRPEMHFLDPRRSRAIK